METNKQSKKRKAPRRSVERNFRRCCASSSCPCRCGLLRVELPGVRTGGGAWPVGPGPAVCAPVCGRVKGEGAGEAARSVGTWWGARDVVREDPRRPQGQGVREESVGCLVTTRLVSGAQRRRAGGALRSAGGRRRTWEAGGCPGGARVLQHILPWLRSQPVGTPSLVCPGGARAWRGVRTHFSLGSPVLIRSRVGKSLRTQSRGVEGPD